MILCFIIAFTTFHIILRLQQTVFIRIRGTFECFGYFIPWFYVFLTIILLIFSIIFIVLPLILSKKYKYTTGEILQIIKTILTVISIICCGGAFFLKVLEVFTFKSIFLTIGKFQFIKYSWHRDMLLFILLEKYATFSKNPYYCAQYILSPQKIEEILQMSKTPEQVKRNLKKDFDKFFIYHSRLRFYASLRCFLAHPEVYSEGIYRVNLVNKYIAENRPFRFW